MVDRILRERGEWFARQLAEAYQSEHSTYEQIQALEEQVLLTGNLRRIVAEEFRKANLPDSPFGQPVIGVIEEAIKAATNSELRFNERTRPVHEENQNRPLGEILKDMREEAHLSQAELIKGMEGYGDNSTIVSLVESGKRPITGQYIIQFVRFMGMTPSGNIESPKAEYVLFRGMHEFFFRERRERRNRLSK